MLWRIVCWSNTQTYTHANLTRILSETGNKLSVSQMSAVLTHHHLSKHTISDSDFTIILTSGSFKFDLEMRESLLISNWNLYLTIISPLCLCIDSNLTWYKYVDISVLTNDLAHCFCNYLIIRPFLFEFLPFVI